MVVLPFLCRKLSMMFSGKTGQKIHHENLEKLSTEHKKLGTRKKERLNSFIGLFAATHPDYKFYFSYGYWQMSKRSRYRMSGLFPFRAPFLNPTDRVGNAYVLWAHYGTAAKGKILFICAKRIYHMSVGLSTPTQCFWCHKMAATPRYT